MKWITCLLAFVLCAQIASAQDLHRLADSIRLAYKIPELGYAVVSSDKILALEVLGFKKYGSKIQAETSDRFRIGSNTKAITSLIAAQLVARRKLGWNTKFFELFPELKEKSHPAYHQLSLLDLLSFRTKLISWTYTYAQPTRNQFVGDEAAQRYQFTAWCLMQVPASDVRPVHVSNPGYVAAALMLEKASGKSYKQLVAALGSQLGIDFGFGQPNNMAAAQPWGHDAQLKPEPPGKNYKLAWLQAAGNINISLPDYARFMQEQLKGLHGHSALLPQETFRFLYYGLPQFALGWFWEKDAQGKQYAYNIGNPGSFLSKVYVCSETDKAYILFSNAQTGSADAGLNLLYERLQQLFKEQQD
jgi:CubicO group peptidase (beta-lactamase class C family)